MKKLFLFLIPGFFLFITPLTFAQNNKNNYSAEKYYKLSSLEVVNKDLFAAGERVEISGTVNGDVYVAGGQVYVDGTINGDLLAVGGSINISGKITQNIRIAGGNIVFSGNVGRNATVAGGNLEFTKEGSILGSLVTAGGNLNIMSPVSKDLTVGAGNASIISSVGGDLTAGVGQLSIGSKTVVGGDLKYWSDNEAIIDTEAVISGNTQYNRTQTADSFSKYPDTKKIMGAGRVANHVFTLVLGIILVLVFPKFFSDASEKAREKFSKSFLWGIAGAFLFFTLFLILLLTILGIPLAVLLLFAYMLAIYIGRMVIMYATGAVVLRKLGDEQKGIWSYLVGFLIYLILVYIPIIRSIAPAVYYLTGFGALILLKKEKPQIPVLQKAAKKRPSKRRS